jgi:phosphotransferase system enzyme I (PtsP)
MKNKIRNHFNILYDIGDLSALLTESSDIETFLQSTVNMISRYLNSDVCSIYLYNERSKDLVLKATVGLNPGAVNKIRMKPGEGLVGSTFENLRPLRDARASLNPKFKYFEEAAEDRFESFLSVPIVRGSRRIGVLVVQHEQRDFFSEIDLVVLRALSAQLAGTIESARLLTDMRHKQGEVKQAPSAPPDIAKQLQFVKGESASGGYVCSGVSIFKRSHGSLLSTDADPEPGRTYSLDDFYKAVQKTSDQLIEFQSRLAEQLLESASLIFDAHFMILKDAQFMNKIVHYIVNGFSPPQAVKEVSKYYIDIFSSSSNEYLREKVNDVEDLSGRILKNLYNWSGEDPRIPEGGIVIARELYPSEVLKLASEGAKGIILVSGGVTSHVSILSRSLKVPLVIANRPELLNLQEGTTVLLDADIGNIYVRPTDEVIRQFESRQTTEKATTYIKDRMLPVSQTKDGVRIRLLANINLLSELSLARDLKAEGIGLYRTEFPFLIRSAYPSEEEQYLIYKRLFDEMAGREVTIRTLDIGGDKMLAYSTPTAGTNPELGLRSIRFSLHCRDIFEQQIRAILRAAADTEEVRLMFPMISSLDEFIEAKQFVLECMNALKQENIPYHEHLPLGMMLELPSVVGIIRELSEEADFFSIGTNDFIQYMIGVDRTNEKVAHYYCPHHPSVLRSLAEMVRVVTAENKDIAICGEMAHEIEYISFLLGIGVRKISVDPQFLPRLQEKIGSLKLSDAEEHAKKVLSEATLKGTREALNS